MMLDLFRQVTELGHEQVLFSNDPASHYRSIIAVHSTRLGPAVGGARLWRYPTEHDALVDALRLSRGMTYKCAMAGLPFGGGKAVIFRPDEPFDRERLFRAHGRTVDTLGGRYITAEDVGVGVADIEIASTETRHVGGLAGGSGDPSPWTARGVKRAIEASAAHRWGSSQLASKTIAIQGCGQVGYYLARELHAVGARLIATDTDAGRLKRVVDEFGATALPSGAIFDAGADIFAPCALGGILNDETIPRLKVEIVAGAANNQLWEPQHGEALEQRRILYAPDFVANAGGIINGCGREMLGWTLEQARDAVDKIYDTLLSVFEQAHAERITTAAAAERIAEHRLHDGGLTQVSQQS